VQQFDRREKRIHVNMQNRLLSHAHSIAKDKPVSQSAIIFDLISSCINDGEYAIIQAEVADVASIADVPTTLTKKRIKKMATKKVAAKKAPAKKPVAKKAPAKKAPAKKACCCKKAAPAKKPAAKKAAPAKKAPAKKAKK
jgi:hypothetical protein